MTTASGLDQVNRHTEFTVGSRELTITAIRRDGNSLVIMENGQWSDQLKTRAIR